MVWVVAVPWAGCPPCSPVCPSRCRLLCPGNRGTWWPVLLSMSGCPTDGQTLGGDVGESRVTVVLVFYCSLARDWGGFHHSLVIEDDFIPRLCLVDMNGNPPHLFSFLCLCLPSRPGNLLLHNPITYFNCFGVQSGMHELRDAGHIRNGHFLIALRFFSNAFLY